MDDEVDLLGGEAVPAEEVGADLLDEIALVVGDLPAVAADEVEGVVGVGELPAAAVVAEADLLDEVEVVEQREGPVDAREVDVGDPLGHPVVDLLGGEVAVGLAQHVPDELALRRHPVALIAQARGDVHARIMPDPTRGPKPPAALSSRPMRLQLTTHLDDDVLAEILDLIEVTTRIDGHRPVGEHKYAHLAVGASAWTGVLARDEGGALIGYAHTRWGAPGAVPRVAVELVVHPEHRGGGEVARALLAETCGVVGRAGGGRLWLWVHRVEDPADTLAAELGFTVQRDLAFMTRPLREAPPPGELPEGVTLAAYVPGRDDEELLRVNNAAFAGHPENGDWDADELARRRALPWFDPDDVLLAWRGERLLGFHWTKYHGHDTEEVPAHEPVGEVYILGVDPAAQGLGLGKALLREGLRHLHDRGCELAVLYVDRASTGAVRLYEREGFTIAYHEVCYEDEVAPAPDAAAADLRYPAP